MLRNLKSILGNSGFKELVKILISLLKIHVSVRVRLDRMITMTDNSVYVLFGTCRSLFSKNRSECGFSEQGVALLCVSVV